MDDGLGWQGWLTVAVIAATLGLLLWERFTPDKVLAGAMATLMVGGVLTPVQALAGFWNPGVLTVALLFVLVAALKTTGAIRWIGDWVLGRPRSTLHAQARLVGISAPLSAFINNTPIVAMLTSAVEQWSRRGGTAPSKLLMPMNYATILGGMCTLVGTSTNLIVAGLAVQAGLPALHMFTPFGVGVVAAVAGVAYLLTIGRWLLPERRSTLQQAVADVREYVVEMLVEDDGELVGKTIGEAGLRHLEGSYLLELVRGNAVHAAVSPLMRLRGGDRLVFVGRTGAVGELRLLSGLRPATEQVFKVDDAGGRRPLVEVVLSRFSPAVGRTLVDSAFRSHYNAAVIAISRHGQRLHRKPGDVVLLPGDTLLIETDSGFVERHGRSPDFLVVSEIDGPARVGQRKAIAVLAIIGMMVVANTLLGVNILFSALGAAVAVVAARCVGLAELRRSFDLRLLAVIACAFALGAALKESGVAALVAALLAGWAGSEPFWTLVLVYVATIVFTEMLTNNAAAVLMFPIGLAAAQQLGVEQMPFVIAVMMGASAGFITPIGYQTNMMIYGPGGYRFSDYLRVGMPLSLVVGGSVLWAIPRMWPF
ncbi:TRAP transporter large permease subunit [Lysobacter maris]|uniref:TRAP transporter large permease subunit n=1 Tax=Marilutibacter maris TaxID=1605891 RepID=A0A508AHD5_9GAMM|nr:SLC13 family permease [Lysobacter maris]KAB8179323.1 TRAP transporter large permease subunit [Lysobacter maris]